MAYMTVTKFVCKQYVEEHPLEAAMVAYMVNNPMTYNNLLEYSLMNHLRLEGNLGPGEEIVDDIVADSLAGRREGGLPLTWNRLKILNPPPNNLGGYVNKHRDVKRQIETENLQTLEAATSFISISEVEFANFAIGVDNAIAGTLDRDLLRPTTSPLRPATPRVSDQAVHRVRRVMTGFRERYRVTSVAVNNHRFVWHYENTNEEVRILRNTGRRMRFLGRITDGGLLERDVTAQDDILVDFMINNFMAFVVIEGRQPPHICKACGVRLVNEARHSGIHRDCEMSMRRDAGGSVDRLDTEISRVERHLSDPPPF